MTHEKRPDWVDRLSACIRARQHLPLAWGTNDCMTWAADCVEAQTGADDLAAYRGQYDDMRSALRALRRIDGVRLPLDLMDKLWGPRQPVAWAKLGDLVVADLGSPRAMGPSVGVCYGRNSLFVGTDAGQPGLVRLETLSLEHCYQPWASSSKA